MPRTRRLQSHIVVADPRPRDYRQLLALAGEFGWHVHLLLSGAAALQFARRMAADLWLINGHLDDMSGCDLVAMLRELPVRSPLFLIGNHYDAEEERKACACGAGTYLCKDAARSLDCQPVVAALANRGPPQPAEVTRRAVG
ncbi:MAG TPA: response regulator [Pirellulales bacterium]|nr:response regulator [Pirellulales bacterium]